jgi:hypothetical protein
MYWLIDFSATARPIKAATGPGFVSAASYARFNGKITMRELVQNRKL